MRRTLLPLVLLALAGGCSTLQQPTASFRSASVGEVTSRGFTLNVDVDLRNPNAVTLPLTQGDYSIALAGVRVIDRSRVSPEGSLPANGSRAVTIPVALTFENLLAAEEAVRRGGGTIPYRLDAALEFDSGMPLLAPLRVPFDYEGSLDVKELLRRNWSTILNSPAAQRLARETLGNFGDLLRR